MSSAAIASTPASRSGAASRALLYRFTSQVHSRAWQGDAAQDHALAALQSLLAELASDGPTPPRGLWLFGPPGRGKSCLLDMFMAEVPLPAKRRVHFHAFMEEVHRRLHAMPVTSGPADPLIGLADELALEAGVLGFDEFYLTNIADAMLLGRLMKLLFQRGVVVVATSNWPLPELFQGGLNRDRFTPFLHLMETHLQPVDLRDGPDYRRSRPGQASTAVSEARLPPYYIVTAPGESAEAQLHVLFQDFTDGASQPPLKGWPVGSAIKRQRGRAAWLTFAQACDTPRSRTDYARLAAHFDTVIIEAIPLLGPQDADATLRLTTLVDILYEQRRRLVVSAAAAPDDLCYVPASSQSAGGKKQENTAATVFQRTASRLMELTRPPLEHKA